ncbi:DUF1857 family protein [Leeia sp. TBRC 13508]|uniref:DUF1857 family protein n=1 Tax=Leeia speluncae TaxID=2884804 RepID=A0ABS8D799_9NEIS|nr:SRPBCC family protein [Leeia speluncae]MCB6184057.1 DUF1857 family protein [Leeia speluncae]
MKFEHIIEINDLANPMVTPLSVEQLWQGLMLRVESPQLFLPHMDEVLFLARGDNWLEREVVFGSMRVRDHIRMDPMVRIEFVTEPNEQHQGGTMSMQIEMPESNRLFVRFAYETGLSETETHNGVNVASYVKQAYQQHDIEMVKLIREMVEEGSLPTTTPTANRLQ